MNFHPAFKNGPVSLVELERCPTPDISVGDAATVVFHNRRLPGTVIYIEPYLGSILVTVQQDAITEQGFEFDELGELYNFRWLSRRWVPVAENTMTGKWNPTPGPSLEVGKREHR